MIGTDAVLANDWVSIKLGELTLEQKVGQMIIAGFPGTTLTAEVAAMLRHCHLGGVMLVGANVKRPAQVAALIDDLQLVSVADSTLPLFVSVDYEGGTVNRLRAPATILPSAMALGATHCVADVEACARAAAHEMHALGMNVNFAPVLDVNSESANPVIGIRSFGDSPALVAEMGVAVVRALREGGVIATAKHFPGHGDTRVDSHMGLPVILRNEEALHSIDLLPFQEAIDSGVDMVMSAHAVYPALSSAHVPATMSSEILVDLLRRKMGFGGLVVTDALVMKAIAERFTLGEAAVLSVRSGADVVLILGTLEQQGEVFEELLRAVNQGDISEATVDGSVARILGAKWRLAASGPARIRTGTDFADWPLEDHQRLAREVTRKSITLVKNDGGTLPLRLPQDARLGLIEFVQACFSPVEDGGCDEGWVRQLLHKRHANLRYLGLDVVPNDGASDLGRFVEDCEAIVVVTRNAHIISSQAAMVRQVLKFGKPTAVLAARNPYDIASFPSATSYVASYGDSYVSLEAAVALLFGDYQPCGRLPVAIPGLFPYGHGLDCF